MNDKEKMVHDLALIHVMEKYHEIYGSLSPDEKRVPMEAIGKIVDQYKLAVMCIAPRIGEITEAYTDDDGAPVIPE